MPLRRRGVGGGRRDPITGSSRIRAGALRWGGGRLSTGYWADPSTEGGRLEARASLLSGRAQGRARGAALREGSRLQGLRGKWLRSVRVVRIDRQTGGRIHRRGRLARG